MRGQIQLLHSTFAQRCRFPEDIELIADFCPSFTSWNTARTRRVMLGVIHRSWVEEPRWGSYIDDFNFIFVIVFVDSMGSSDDSCASKGVSRLFQSLQLLLRASRQYRVGR